MITQWAEADSYSLIVFSSSTRRSGYHWWESAWDPNINDWCDCRPRGKMEISTWPGVLRGLAHCIEWWQIVISVAVSRSQEHLSNCPSGSSFLVRRSSKLSGLCVLRLNGYCTQRSILCQPHVIPKWLSFCSEAQTLKLHWQLYIQLQRMGTEVLSSKKDAKAPYKCHKVTQSHLCYMKHNTFKSLFTIDSMLWI